MGTYPDGSKPNHHNHPVRERRSVVSWATELLIAALIGAGVALIAYGVWGLGVLVFG